MMTIIKALTLAIFLNGADASKEHMKMKIKNTLAARLGLHSSVMNSNESCTANLERLADIQ